MVYFTLKKLKRKRAHLFLASTWSRSLSCSGPYCSPSGVRNRAELFTPLGATLAMDNNQRCTTNSSVESNPREQKILQLVETNSSGSCPLNMQGYDVVAIACPGRYVVGLGISEEAIKKAKQMSFSLPNTECRLFYFLEGRFFSPGALNRFV